MAEKAGGLPTVAGIQVEYIENRTFDEIEIGESASLERTLTEQDITLFAVMSGDINPAHVDPEYEEQPFSGGDRSRHVERCAHLDGAWNEIQFGVRNIVQRRASRRSRIRRPLCEKTASIGALPPVRLPRSGRYPIRARSR